LYIWQNEAKFLNDFRRCQIRRELAGS